VQAGVDTVNGLPARLSYQQYIKQKPNLYAECRGTSGRMKEPCRGLHTAHAFNRKMVLIQIAREHFSLDKSIQLSSY
jgi:hypothetical protein